MAANIFIKVTVNGSTTDFTIQPNTTAAQLGASARFREAFGLASNISLFVNGAATTRALRAGDEITVRTAASSKAASVFVKVTVNGSSTDYNVSSTSTANSLAGDKQFREDFGLSTNIQVRVNGAVGVTRYLRAGDEITVSTAASSKAIA